MYDQHIILDFEMNPVSKINSQARATLKREIIEIGAVKLNSEYTVIDKFNCFIRPAYSSSITDYITKLTGINTTDVCDAMSYEDALEEFNTWIGEGKNRVYSWSDSDFRQIVTECEYKHVKFPKNITRWMDFQLLFPRLMGLNHNVLMSLHDAAEWYGTEMDCKSAHRALYDAEITVELIRGVLTGEYKEIARKIHQYYKPSGKPEEQHSLESCLGDLYGDIFHNLLLETQDEVTR